MKKTIIKINNINSCLTIIKDKNNKIIYQSKSYIISLFLKSNDVYKIYILTFKNTYLIPIYSNKNIYIINLIENIKKTFVLTDKFYKNLPIMKGVIWLNAT